jgi:hypothetical protein
LKLDAAVQRPDIAVVLASSGELKHRCKGRSGLAKFAEFERKENEERKQIWRKTVEIDEFANLDNAHGRFVPRKDVHSENDRLLNVEVPAEERNQNLVVARNREEGRVQEQNRERFVQNGPRAMAAKMKQRSAVHRSKTEVETEGKDGEVIVVNEIIGMRLGDSAIPAAQRQIQ